MAAAIETAIDDRHDSGSDRDDRHDGGNGNGRHDQDSDDRHDGGCGRDGPRYVRGDGRHDGGRGRGCYGLPGGSAGGLITADGCDDSRVDEPRPDRL